MPRMTQEAVQTVAPEVVNDLTPEQELLLLREIAIYAECKHDVDEAERDAAVAKDIVEGLRDELGYKSIRCSTGAIVTRVTDGETSKLDLKRLCRDFKITPKTLATYYTKTPKKDYTLITLPKPEESKDAKAKTKRPVERDERDDYEDRE